MSRAHRGLRITLAAAALAAGTVAVASAYRDTLIESAARRQFLSAEDPAFLTRDAHIRVLLCGTGSPERGPAHQACTLVAAGGRVFLFDAGDGAAQSLALSGVPLPSLQHAFLTHLHSDHFNGLGAVVSESWIWGRAAPLVVSGPPGTAALVAGLNAAYRQDIAYRSEHVAAQGRTAAAAPAQAADVALPAGADRVRVYDSDGVTIDAYRVSHAPVEPAFGYILNYAGKTVFISGDTDVSEGNLAAMQGADLVVHEAYAAALVARGAAAMRALGRDADADIAETTGSYHADTLALAEQAERAGVEHLVLTHLIPYPRDGLARWLFVEGMRERYHGTLTLGEDGMLLTL